MSDLTIRTNNHFRPLCYGYELPNDVLAIEFDWLDDAPQQFGFFHYRGHWYHQGEFMTTDAGVGAPSEFAKWHGYHSDSYFSGVLIRYADDSEHVQVATYYS